MEKVKKPIYKKWWFWVIIVVVVFAIAAGGSGSDKKDSKKNSATGERDIFVTGGRNLGFWYAPHMVDNGNIQKSII